MLKICVYEVLRMALQDLVGKCFSVAEGDYRIVDVRNLAGDALVYAEKRQGLKEFAPSFPKRAAFHYGDIARYLAQS